MFLEGLPIIDILLALLLRIDDTVVVLTKGSVVDEVVGLHAVGILSGNCEFS